MDTFVVIAGIGVIFWGLTILAIIDVLLKDFGSTKTKAIWGLTALVPFVGWLVYLVFGFRKGTKKTPQP
jgi:uncharacterized membrane protein YhaH (DUF805 family)